MGIDILRMTIMEFSALIVQVMMKFAACYATRAGLHYKTIFEITMEATIRFAARDPHPSLDMVRPHATRVVGSFDALSQSVAKLFYLVTSAADEWRAAHHLLDVVSEILVDQARTVPLRWFELPGAADTIVCVTGLAGSIELLAPWSAPALGKTPHNVLQP